jgi:hypothetical protein
MSKKTKTTQPQLQNETKGENFSYVIYSSQKIRGIYNYDAYYKIDYSSFFNKYPNDTKFKVCWFLGSRSKINITGDMMGLLFIDFSTKINQQDSNLNNNCQNMGLVEVKTRTISSSTYYYIVNKNESETITISKPTSNIVRVYFRTCNNLYYFNGSNEGDFFLPTLDLPDFYVKLEFEPIL